MLGIILHWAFNRRRISVQGKQLEEALSTFYRKRVNIADIRPATSPRRRFGRTPRSTAPVNKTNGFGMPGFQSGHFRMRGGGKAFCLLTDHSRVLVLPLHDGSLLLASPEQPRVLLDDLKVIGDE